MNKDKDFVEKRKYTRYRALDRLKNIKILKEKDKEGNIESFTVIVDRGGHSVKHRFPDMKGAFVFVRDFDHGGDSFYDRKHRRIYSLNIISYECFNKEGLLVSQGMGRTLNISKGGILLETYLPLDTENIMSISIDTEIDLVMDIKAKPIYCKACENGKFESGIQFMELNETAEQIVIKHVKSLKDQMAENK